MVWVDNLAFHLTFSPVGPIFQKRLLSAGAIIQKALLHEVKQLEENP